MPTVAEMELLNRAMGDLSGTFQRNRLMSEDARSRRVRESMEKELLGQRRSEFDQTTGQRKKEFEAEQTHRKSQADALEAHRKRLEAIQATRRADERQAKVLEFLGDMNKSGQLTDDGLATLNAKFSEMLGAAGLGVKLFRVAPAKDSAFNTRAGRNLELAESYRQRAADALRNGGGSEAERFRAIAERLERGVGPEGDSEPGADLTVPVRDPATGEEVGTVRRRVPAGQLDAEMQRLTGGGAAAAPAGSKELTAEKAREFLKQAGGDKAKARELARQAGYKF